MSIILFALGAGALLIGAVRFGPIQAEGTRVRAAGFVLTLPLILTSVLSVMLRMIFGDSAVEFANFLELPAMAIAVGVAYYLLTREGDGAPTIIPGPGKQEQDAQQDKQQNQSETGQQKPSSQQRQSGQQTTRRQPPPKPRNQRDAVSGSGELETANRRAQSGGNVPRRRGNYPTVMTIREAASYLNMTEQAVTNLIEEGKLAAARVNYRYRISRSVLDDFISEQQQENNE